MRAGWLLIVLVALLVSCKGGDDSADSKITLQLNWKPEPQFGGFYAAAQSGAFKKRGLYVEIVPGGVGTPTVQMVGTGKVPFALVSADELIVARTKGNDVVALFAVYQTCPQGIMVHRARAFTEIGDVFRNEGTVAIQRGLPYATFLENKYGFGKVKIVPSPGGSVAAFLADTNFSQQCFITSEPILAKRQGADPHTFLVAEAGYNPYTTVLVTSRDYLKKHPKTVAAMAAAVKEGWEQYLLDPAPTNGVMQGLNPTMDLATFEASAAAQKELIQPAESKGQGVGGMSRERWATLGQQLVELKVIDKAPPPEECFVEAEKLADKP